jgi:hypothetical protein
MACGVWHVVYGMWCMACGLWHVVYGMWCMACGVWRVVYGMWSMACGVWHVVYGMWSMVRGLWCVVYGMWSMPPTPHLYQIAFMLRDRLFDSHKDSRHFERGVQCHRRAPMSLLREGMAGSLFTAHYVN